MWRMQLRLDTSLSKTLSLAVIRLGLAVILGWLSPARSC